MDVSEAAAQGEEKSKTIARLELVSGRALGLIATAVLFAMMALTFVDVVGRYRFNAPVYGGYELTEFMMGVLIFSALPILCVREGHVTIDILDGVLPKPWVRPQRAFVNLVSAVALAAMARQLWLYSVDLIRNNEVTMTLKIPHGPFAGAFAVLAGLAAIACLVNCVGYIMGTRQAASTLS
jgi:TRAP-type C4-dicarboxylate transport system permease small subunit